MSLFASSFILMIILSLLDLSNSFLTSTNTNSKYSLSTSASTKEKTSHQLPHQKTTLPEVHSEHRTSYHNTNHFSSSSRKHCRSYQHTESERGAVETIPYSTAMPSRVENKRNRGNIERRKVQLHTSSYSSQSFDLAYEQNSQAERLSEPSYE